MMTPKKNQILPYDGGTPAIVLPQPNTGPSLRYTIAHTYSLAGSCGASFG